MENEIKQNYENFLLKEKFNDSQINNKKNNLDNFFKRGFPNRRLEDWKFSDFNQVVNANIENLNYIAEIDNNIVFDQRPIEDFDHNKIFILNGKIIKSDLGFEDQSKIEILEDHSIDQEDLKNSLLNLNNAFTAKHYKIHVKEGYLAKKPLILYHNVSENLKSSLVSLRLDIDLDNDLY